MNKALRILILAAALGAVYAWMYRAAQPTGTPTGQVRATVLDAADALQRGDAGEAMRAVSSDYKDSTGTNRDRLYFLAREAARYSGDWDVVIEDMRINVEGDEATVQADISLRAADVGRGVRRTIDLRMRREDAVAMLVVPTARWRIVSADNLPFPGVGFDD